nr:L421 [uncultured bacterium]
MKGSRFGRDGPQTIHQLRRATRMLVARITHLTAVVADTSVEPAQVTETPLAEPT